MRAFARSVVAVMLAPPAALLAATDVTGHIRFAGAAVPGATVTAMHDDHRLTTTSDADGAFRLTALDDGVWTIRVDLRGFVPMNREITIPLVEPVLDVTLTMQSYNEIVGSAAVSHLLGRLAQASPPRLSRLPPTRLTS